MDNKKYLEIYKKRPTYKFYINLIILVAVIAYAFYVSITTEPADINSKSVNVGVNIIEGIFTPTLSLFFTTNLNENIIFLLFQTIAIAFLGTLFGSVLAIIPSFLGAKNITGKYVSAVTRFILTAIRTIPVLVYALMFIRIAGIGPAAGVLTFSITSIGMISKLYIETIEELDSGVLESLTACGASLFRKIRYGVIPQIQAQFVSTSIYRFEINVRDASTLGIVGAGGIGTPLILAISESRYHDVGAYLLGLIILVIIIETFSNKLRNKLING